MAVTIHEARPTDLADAEIDRWRPIPVSIAVDMVRKAGRIDPQIRPLMPAGQQPRLFGRAITAACEPPDFGAVVYSIDLIGPGDVLVIAAGGDARTAMIGDILAGHARRLRGVGIVCDGAVRDVATLAKWPDFSVFARSVAAEGPISAERGEVNGPVVIGGQLVSPGDLIVGDDDGLVILTPALVRSRIVDAEQKFAREGKWIASLESGRSVIETLGLPPASG